MAPKARVDSSEEPKACSSLLPNCYDLRNNSNIRGVHRLPCAHSFRITSGDLSGIDDNCLVIAKHKQNLILGAEDLRMLSALSVA
jgi:hypothetical protein